MFKVGDLVRIRTQEELIANGHKENIDYRNGITIDYWANSICIIGEIKPGNRYRIHFIDEVRNMPEKPLMTDPIAFYTWEEFELDYYRETNIEDDIDISSLLEEEICNM